jgi:uncharacterized short protein YbdD (DUF466 family)
MSALWRLRAGVARLWAFLRAVSGDSAYDEYARRAGAPALSREAFYLDRLRRRYTGPNRCC